jgi:hypothetical protein
VLYTSGECGILITLPVGTATTPQLLPHTTNHTTTMKIDTTSSRHYLITDVTKMVNGYTAQATQIFGSNPSQGEKLLDDLVQAIDERLDYLQTCIAKGDIKEAADRFNGRSSYPRSAGYFEFKQAFSIEASVYVKLQATVVVERNKSIALSFNLTCEVNAHATNRDVVGAVAFGALYQQATNLAAMIQGTGNLFTRMNVLEA